MNKKERKIKYSYSRINHTHHPNNEIAKNSLVYVPIYFHYKFYI